MARRQSHYLFIEDETFNWASPRTASHRRLILSSIMIVTAELLFSMLR
jgi:hypothetical protein